jgi:hypothetical protein
MEWLLPHKLESDETQISGHQKACPQAVESDPEGRALHWTEQGAGLWARICAAMAPRWRSSQCSKS